MKKWTTVDQSLTPDGKPISLHEHDGSYSIKIDNVPLMSTRQHASEERLADLACARLRGVSGARVLIGGLGFGFTLKSALALLAKDAQVVVAEIVGAVIEWNRNAALPLAASALADPRVTVVQRDIGEIIREACGTFDAIIMDVDNGPAALSTGSNARLYDYAGLRATRTALSPKGVVAYWSVAPDAAFERLLAQSGFAVDVQHCHAHGKSGRRHTLLIAKIAPW